MEVWPLVEAVREKRPLVHNITNYVVMNNTANALLALGASPAMVHATDEVEDFVDLSQALVVNIGTLSAEWVAGMRLAVARARAKETPWVLDPVGVGATRLRNRVAADLARERPAVIRGNASEILFLAGEATKASKGVDSIHSSDDAVEVAKGLANLLQTVVAVSGAVDIITDGTRTVSIADGHSWMPLVTGMGCTATALIGAFTAVAEPFSAAVAGLAVLGVAGRRAAEQAAGPGTLQLYLLDWLHRLDRETTDPRFA